jgi:uncharacterized protein (DUF433 family)
MEAKARFRVKDPEPQGWQNYQNEGRQATVVKEETTVTDWQGRISFDPSICLRALCTKGTGIHVWGILSCLANGDSIDDVLKAYPNLTREDIYAT